MIPIRRGRDRLLGEIALLTLSQNRRALYYTMAIGLALPVNRGGMGNFLKFSAQSIPPVGGRFAQIFGADAESGRVWAEGNGAVSTGASFGQKRP